MLDDIYHMTLNVFWNHILGMETLQICHIYATLLWVSLRHVAKYLDC